MQQHQEGHPWKSPLNKNFRCVTFWRVQTRNKRVNPRDLGIKCRFQTAPISSSCLSFSSLLYTPKRRHFPWPLNSAYQPRRDLAGRKQLTLLLENNRFSFSTGLKGLPGPTWVLYHYPCPDGVFAALAAFLYHRAVSKDIRFVPNTVYSPKRCVASMFLQLRSSRTFLSFALHDQCSHS